MYGSRAPFGVVASMLLGACGSAHVQAQGQVSTSMNEGDDRKYETPEPATPTEAKSAPTPAPAPPSPEEQAHFLGVSHDLSLGPGVPRTATCQCVMVAVGAPSDPRFVWQGGPPKVDPETLAVAIASDGVACAVAGLAPLRASISGVEVRGTDVVLTVENVREGRPVMRGALVTRPVTGSSLVVVGKKGTPYGSPPQGGAGACRIALMK